MILSGHQPVFMPSLHLLHKIAHSDAFMVVEGVAFNDKSWQNRNRLRAKAGPLWLTVPVRTRGRTGQRIADVEIDERGPWRRKHLRTLDLLYGKAPGYAPWRERLHAIYETPGQTLAQHNRDLLALLLEAYSLTLPVLHDGDFELHAQGSARVVEMCRASGATAYLSSAGERAYHEEWRFAGAGLRHYYQRYRTPRYRQQFPGFVPDLSAFDALFCLGSEGARALLGGHGFIFELRADRAAA